MTRYIAFLRGINVGGNKKVPMVDLKKMLEKMGLKNVKTLLNSGNVIFETSTMKPDALARKFEAQFEKTFGFDSHVIIRTMDEIQKLLKAQPFKKIRVTKDTRLYVTFLSDKPKSKLKIPYVSPEKDFTILSVSNSEICSVLTINPGMTTPKAMDVLEKEFGKNSTTRNWNTIGKILK